MLEALCLLLLTSCLRVAEGAPETPPSEEPAAETRVVAATPEPSDDPTVRSEDR